MNDAVVAGAAEAATETSPLAPGTILEERWLGNNERLDLEATERELAALGEGWRLETPHEAFADIDYNHKNQHGALSRNEERRPSAYRTCQPWPSDPSARVVVWFFDGYVVSNYDVNRARARAVRVAGQSSAVCGEPS